MIRSTSTGTAKPRDQLTRLGFSPTTVALLRFLLVHADEPIHLRGLQQALGAGSRSLQRDLATLMALGALQQRTGAGRRIDYVVDKGWALWPALRALVIGLTPPSWLIRDALRTVDGIDAAFVYGSTARGTANADSDVDVFVLGNEVDTRALHRGLQSVAMLTGRPVNPGIFTYRELAEGLGRPDASTRRFLREVLAGPKTWVGGSVSALEPLAIASDAAFSPPVEYAP
ncbi:nucleotidyltransferase domain-containing protein [Gemmatimonas sp.]|uniref:nucleotidyltransferase domain-containing protein n=1 Tax=Gemmatimonas sp. TaxID=1962908 RepID=UPI003DA2C815